MSEQEIRDLIAEGENEFVVGGERRRLFIASTGVIGVYRKGRRRYGYPLSSLTDDIGSIVPSRKPDRTSGAYYRRRMEKVHAMLAKSGFWAKVREGLEVLMKLDDKEIGDLLNMKGDRTEAYRRLGLDRDLGLDTLSVSLQRVKAVPYPAWEADSLKSDLTAKIAEGGSCRHGWRDGYDRTVSVDCRDGRRLGWYSEEYKGCANGHYYILLDEGHAMFCEDD